MEAQRHSPANNRYRFGFYASIRASRYAKSIFCISILNSIRKSNLIYRIGTFLTLSYGIRLNLNCENTSTAITFVQSELLWSLSWRVIGRLFCDGVACSASICYSLWVWKVFDPMLIQHASFIRKHTTCYRTMLLKV